MIGKKRSGFKRLVAGLMIVGFVAGLNGAALAMGEKEMHEGHRHHMMFDRLAKHLELTDAQKTKVEAILKTKMEQVRKIHEQVRPQIEAIRKSTDQEIRAILTPDQQVKFQQLMDDKEKRMKEHWKLKMKDSVDDQ